jgi:sigma-B regulation protein RsbU (phosphoserine phosphatase)
MISALNEVDSVIRCVELGAEDYLPKPFNPILLRARVGASLEKKRLRDEVKASLARLEEELDQARKMQLGMLPRVFPACSPEQPVEVYASMEPAREVGGDLYDCFYACPHLFCFLVGDVCRQGRAGSHVHGAHAQPRAHGRRSLAANGCGGDVIGADRRGGQPRALPEQRRLHVRDPVSRTA